MATNGYARIGGVAKGVELEDINPNKQLDIRYGMMTRAGIASMPVNGYKKMAIYYANTSGLNDIIAYKKDGTSVSIASRFSGYINTWSNFADISDDIESIGISVSISATTFYYSLQA